MVKNTKKLGFGKVFIFVKLYINSSSCLVFVIFNYKCNRPGHLARDCNDDISKPIQCHRCQGFGHIARNCTTDLQCSRRNNEEDSVWGYKSQSFLSRRRSSTLDSSESDSTTPPVTRRGILKSSQPESNFSKPSSKMWRSPTPPIGERPSSALIGRLRPLSPPVMKKGILKSASIEKSSTRITDSRG